MFQVETNDNNNNNNNNYKCNVQLIDVGGDDNNN